MNFGERLSSGMISRVNALRYRIHLTSSNKIARIYAGPTLEPVEANQSTKVLVISPHQDDEIIGCGGTLGRFVEKGSHIKVAYLTDGRHGVAAPPEEQVRVRMEEAERGLRVLGISDAVFLGYPDGMLTPDRAPVGSISRIMDEYGPDVVFVPYFLDTHADHAAAAKITGSALRHYRDDLVCYSYEVWTALSPNVIVDVTDIMDTKLLALREHRSQVEQLDYPEKVKGLNAYRSMCAGPGATHCEAFIRQTKEEFLRMLSK